MKRTIPRERTAAAAELADEAARAERASPASNSPGRCTRSASRPPGW
jgi:hypothetical protein